MLKRVAFAVLLVAGVGIGNSAFAVIGLLGGAVAPPLCVHLTGTTKASGEGRFVVLGNGDISGTITMQGAEGTKAYIQQGTSRKEAIYLKRGPSDTWVVPRGSKLPSYQRFLDGDFYVIVHAAGGDIRGQLLPNRTCPQ